MINSRRRKIIQVCFLIFCLVAMTFLCCFQLKYDDENDVVSDVSIKVINDKLTITWSVCLNTKISGIRIVIYNEDNVVDSAVVVSKNGLYQTSDLKRNSKYRIVVDALYENGFVKEIESKDFFYFDKESLSGLPTFYINTNSGQDSTASYMTAPDGLWGATSYDNEYLKATMEYVAFDKKFESKLKIRIRGNTSSFYDKKPYKIVLDNPLDLTNSGSEYAHKEWILLNSGDTINNFLGEVISKEVGVEWTPCGIYVNLVLNGDYKGIYTLVEPVSQSTSHGLVNKDGVIFENDAYFWNSNGIYFKLYYQQDQMGYTFKYPEIKSSNDKLIFEVCEYMQNFVNLSFENDESTWEYADLDNFVSYMIAKDLTANGDAGGSNIYYYIEDFNDSSKKKIKIGPLWDFDYLADINMSGERFIYNVYSSQHTNNFLPFVDNEEFNDAYWKRWEELTENILEDIFDSLDRFCLVNGEAINQSRYLDSLRWSDGTYQKVEDELSVVKEWLIKQVDFLNSEMEKQ